MTAALRREESFRSGLVRSVGFHAFLAGIVIGWGYWNFGSANSWGDPNAIPGSGFAITPVDRIPLPTRSAPPNPKADDSESNVEKAEKAWRDQDRVERAEPDAIALNSKNAPRAPRKAASRYVYRSSDDLRKNQLRTSVGQAMSNPMFGTVGAGGVGVGAGTPFGNRFGYYTDLLRRRISESWRTGDVDPIVRTAKPVIVSFDILRNGSVQNVRVVLSSGIPSLDLSARRAILEAAPLPELPREFERNSANVEFTFQLQR